MKAWTKQTRIQRMRIRVAFGLNTTDSDKQSDRREPVAGNGRFVLVKEQRNEVDLVTTALILPDSYQQPIA
jgi:hypothetical protein